MTRFDVTATPAAAHGGTEMSELKRTVRETEADVKEAWRKADGDESLGDKAANVGEGVGNAIENAGDVVHKEADEAARDAAYQQGRADEMARR